MQFNQEPSYGNNIQRADTATRTSWMTTGSSIKGTGRKDSLLYTPPTWVTGNEKKTNSTQPAEAGSSVFSMAEAKEIKATCVFQKFPADPKTS